MSLLAIARRHCLASRPALCLKPFVKDAYGVRYEFLIQIDHAHRRPSAKLLTAIAATHTRLFPTEPIPFPLPEANPQLN